VPYGGKFYRDASLSAGGLRRVQVTETGTFTDTRTTANLFRTQEAFAPGLQYAFCLQDPTGLCTLIYRRCNGVPKRHDLFRLWVPSRHDPLPEGQRAPCGGQLPTARVATRVNAIDIRCTRSLSRWHDLCDLLIAPEDVQYGFAVLRLSPLAEPPLTC
jgi:hypothetical protein